MLPWWESWADFFPFFYRGVRGVGGFAADWHRDLEEMPERKPAMARGIENTTGYRVLKTP